MIGQISPHIEHLRNIFAGLTYGVIENHTIQPLQEIAQSKICVCSGGGYLLAHEANKAGLKYDFLATQHKIGTYSAGHRSVLVQDSEKHYLFSHSVRLRVMGEEVDGRTGAIAKLHALSRKHDIALLHHLFVDLEKDHTGWDESQVDLTALDYKIGGRLCDQMDRLIGYR